MVESTHLHGINARILNQPYAYTHTHTLLEAPKPAMHCLSFHWLRDTLLQISSTKIIFILANV